MTGRNGTHVVEPTVRVQCQAQHPDPRRRGERCGSVLGDIPVEYRFVGLAARRTDQPNGKLQIRCERSDCRTINLFEAPHG